jgi:hypothetical protein
MVPPCGSIIQGTMIGLSIIRDYQLSNWGNNSSLLWIIQGSIDE